MAVHLHAQVLERSHARRGGDAPRRRTNQTLVDPADRAELGDGHLAQRCEDRLHARGVLVEPRAVHQALLDEHGGHRCDQPRVAARAHAQVEVGHRCGLGDARVDHDHRPVRIGGDGLQRDAGVGDAVSDPRVLAGEERHLAVLEVAPHRHAEHLPHHEHLAGLLLRDRIRAPARPQRTTQRRAVGATEVVPLPATAVVRDGFAAVGVAHGRQPVGDLTDGRVPVDLLVRAIGATTQRLVQPLTSPVLVVVEPQGLLAGVALRRRVGLVATDAVERPAVSAQSHLDAAVALAQMQAVFFHCPASATSVSSLNSLPLVARTERTPSIA